MLGFGLQALAPIQTISEGKPAIAAVAGLLSLLLALVLGLFLWTAFGVYSTQQSEARTLGVTVLHLDYLFEAYGPEAAPGRQRLRQAMRRLRDRFFGSHGAPVRLKLVHSRDSFHFIDAFFASHDGAKQEILAAARPMATAIVHTQMLMSRQLSNPLPNQLLTMVSCWTCLLFLCFGITATLSVFAVAANVFGSIAVGSAVFLIVELSEPYSGVVHFGVVRISSEGIDEVLGDLDECVVLTAG